MLVDTVPSWVAVLFVMFGRNIRRDAQRKGYKFAQITIPQTEWEQIREKCGLDLIIWINLVL